MIAVLIIAILAIVAGLLLNRKKKANPGFKQALHDVIEHKKSTEVFKQPIGYREYGTINRGKSNWVNTPTNKRHESDIVPPTDPIYPSMYVSNDDSSSPPLTHSNSSFNFGGGDYGGGGSGGSWSDSSSSSDSGGGDSGGGGGGD